LFDKDKLTVKELSTGGSVFSLWAQHPVFSNEEGKISFVGGAPEGFQGGGGLVLKAVFFAEREGDSKLFFSDGFSVFLSDGKGTKISPEQKSFSISILRRSSEVAPKDEWKSFIEGDKDKVREFVKDMTKRLENVLDGGWQESSKRDEFLKEVKRIVQELVLKEYKEDIKVSDFHKYLNRLVDIVIKKF